MLPVRPNNRPVLSPELEDQLRSMMPLFDEFIENVGIPEEYFIDVPFEHQEQVHYSGAACARISCDTWVGLLLARTGLWKLWAHRIIEA
jgi:hypothetical protein